MTATATDRRHYARYGVHLQVQYRVSPKGEFAQTGRGRTVNMSSGGVSFRCRKPLQVGAHIEVLIDWPAKSPDAPPVNLSLMGFVVRSDARVTAVHVTSSKFLQVAA